MASPLTLNQSPNWVSLSSKIGRMVPSFVGPTFIKILPPQLTVIITYLEVKMLFKLFIVNSYFAFVHTWDKSSPMVITSLRLKSLLMPQDFLSMVRAFSHLCSIKWPGCHLSGPEKKLPCFWPTPRPHLSLVTTRSLAGLQNFNIHHSGYPNKL